MERKPRLGGLLLQLRLHDVRNLEGLDRLVVQLPERVGEAAPRELVTRHALPVIDVVPIEETFRPVGELATRAVKRVRAARVGYLLRRRR